MASEGTRTEEFDLVVIGTGEGGSTPATKCRSAGWRVAVVDNEPFGGTCALRGCDPKKVLVGAADVVARQQRMAGHGTVGETRIDWPALMRFKASFTENVPANRERALNDAGIVTLHGEAAFTDHETLVVGDRRLRAKHFVIAAGAGPRQLGIPGEQYLTTSTDFLELPALPRRVALVGAGYIAFEFAHIAARAGAAVTMLGGTPLARFDRDLVDRLSGYTRDLGIDVRFETEVVGIERTQSSGPLRMLCVAHGAPFSVEADVAIHAAGRRPLTSGLELPRANVKTDERGAIEVNNYLQSVSNPLVYAAGDATRPPDKLPLTPVAAHESAVVASNLLHGNSKQPNYRGTPSVVFTIPPLASVGLTEERARASALDVRVKSADTSTWYSNRRTRTPVGAFKTIVDAGTNRVVGAHLLGDGADEMINLFALAVRLELPLEDVKHAMYAYPSAGSNLPHML